jgi:diketogulonate reductase-like aldo/keto reductase
MARACWRISISLCDTVVGSGYENEHEVGEGICEALKEEGLRREDVFVSGKLWNTQHRKEHVRPACESLLNELGLGKLDFTHYTSYEYFLTSAIGGVDPEYLDLYMIAFPIAWKNTGKNVCDVPKDVSGKVKLDFVPLAETWSAMEELVDAGLVKSIGLANFSSQLISDLLSYCR